MSQDKEHDQEMRLEDNEYTIRRLREGIDALKQNNFSILAQYCSARDKLTELGWCEFWDSVNNTWKWRNDGSGSLGWTAVEGNMQHSARRPSRWERLKLRVLRFFGRDYSPSTSPNFIKNQDHGIKYEYVINKDGIVSVSFEKD